MEVQKSKINPHDKRMNVFLKEYGTLGKDIINAFKEHHEVPKNYTGYAQDYYLNIAENFIKRFKNECARMVFMTLFEEKSRPSKTKAVANIIIASMFQTS